MKVSIVICTDGRAEALSNTLRALRFLNFGEFEVCVVAGPTDDGTHELLQEIHSDIKISRNPVRNLSASRNIGIDSSSGDIIAFLDDDGVPEANWLFEAIRPFEESGVGATGGIVLDHTGARVQYSYASANRLGQAKWDLVEPVEYLNFPFTFNFPYVQGTNSLFRRKALADIGGFDEEYEFYLDETDVCCRLIDSGWKIKQLENAIVHHKFLSSAIRTPDRITRSLYSVLKNKLYFSIVNNRGHYSFKTIVHDMEDFILKQRRFLEEHIRSGKLEPQDLINFDLDVDRAWDHGLKRGLSSNRKLVHISPTSPESSFLSFPRILPPDEKGVFVFLTQQYPPDSVGGVGRYIHQLAITIAERGHQVHILTKSNSHARVDFENHVWVHRVLPLDNFNQSAVGVPAHIWGHSASMLGELKRISKNHQVTAVYAPIWDCEGIAILRDGSFPLVTGLQTSLRFWIETHSQFATEEFMQSFANPMFEIERELLDKSSWIHSISHSIAAEIEKKYDFFFNPRTISYIPLGLQDQSTQKTVRSCQATELTKVLFVGRLEARKGIDILCQIIPSLIEDFPLLSFDIVGNDKLVAKSGQTYRSIFETEFNPNHKGRVTFHGEVSDSDLYNFYESCDIFVAPSRFESFGLMIVEAMMFCKPVVSCAVGGIVEVAVHGETALLAQPNDPSALRDCLVRLINDRNLRVSMGIAGRRRYEKYFTPVRMADGVIEAMRFASKRILEQ